MDYRTWGFVYLGLGPSTAWALGRRTSWLTPRAGTELHPRSQVKLPVVHQLTLLASQAHGVISDGMPCSWQGHRCQPSLLRQHKRLIDQPNKTENAHITVNSSLRMIAPSYATPADLT